MNALRDWGHARDYIEMQWLMLQQDKPEDFVIASGEQYSVRDFVNRAGDALGLTFEWQGEGVEEKGILVAAKDADDALQAKIGQEIVLVDPRYFRPTEVETLLGDASKARNKLGWTPKTSFADLVKEMAESDLREAEFELKVKEHGHKSLRYQG